MTITDLALIENAQERAKYLDRTDALDQFGQHGVWRTAEEWVAVIGNGATVTAWQQASRRQRAELEEVGGIAADQRVNRQRVDQPNKGGRPPLRYNDQGALCILMTMINDAGRITRRFVLNLVDIASDDTKRFAASQVPFDMQGFATLIATAVTTAMTPLVQGIVEAVRPAPEKKPDPPFVRDDGWIKVGHTMSCNEADVFEHPDWPSQPSCAHGLMRKSYDGPGFTAFTCMEAKGGGRRQGGQHSVCGTYNRPEGS